MAICKPKRSLRRNHLCWEPDLRLPASETMPMQIVVPLVFPSVVLGYDSPSSEPKCYKPTRCTEARPARLSGESYHIRKERHSVSCNVSRMGLAILFLVE